MRSGDAVIVTGEMIASDPIDDFESWFRGLAAPGYQLAYAMLHDSSAAEDAVQEAALRAWRGFKSLDRTRPALPWFLTIVANCCRSGWRRNRRGAIPLTEALSSRRDESSAAVQREDLRKAMLRLNQDDRLIVALHFYLDLPLAEVAQIAGLKLPTLKTRLYRAVKTLRPAVEYEDGLQ